MKIFPVAAFAAAFTGALLSGCASLDGGAKTAAPATRPALVVLIVIDGLPMRQITQFRQQFGPDGFARFLDRGTWFANAHYGHAFTVTAAGHATVLTGAYPWRTGIIGNDWRDPATGELVYNTGDAAESYIGHPTKKLDGTSPRRLKAETLGDVLRGLDPRSKVIGVSGKDRGAILPAGKSGTAYMYMALVTGASRGIGAAVCRGLVAEGVSVVVGAREPAVAALAEVVEALGDDITAIKFTGGSSGRPRPPRTPRRPPGAGSRTRPRGS